MRYLSFYSKAKKATMADFIFSAIDLKVIGGAGYVPGKVSLHRKGDRLFIVMAKASDKMQYVLRTNHNLDTEKMIRLQGSVIEILGLPTPSRTTVQHAAITNFDGRPALMLDKLLTRVTEPKKIEREEALYKPEDHEVGAVTHIETKKTAERQQSDQRSDLKAALDLANDMAKAAGAQLFTDETGRVRAKIIVETVL